MIAELDRWVLHRSLEQLGRWRRGPAVHIAGLRTLGVGTSVDDFGVARSTEEQLEATHGRAAAATSA